MSTKKILILSFYFPPCNGTPSPRPESWAKLFAEKGLDVVVATKHWKSGKTYWNEYLESTEISKPYFEEKDGYRIFWLPFKKHVYFKLPFLTKLGTLYSLLRGNIEREADTMQFFKPLQSLLASQKFDLIISTAPPWNIAKLTYRLATKANTDYVVDFRDYENDVVLNKAFKPSFYRKMEFYINRFYIFKWLKNAKFITSASEPLGAYISTRLNIDHTEILNGYEENTLDFKQNITTEKATSKSDIFNVTVLGYLFMWQDITVITEGIKLFLDKNSQPKIRFNFIGQRSIEKVCKLLEEAIPKQHLNITNRKSQKEAIVIGKDSDVLLYAGWKDWVGVYSAKLFTYLGLRKNILIAPGDGDVIEKVVKETNTGKIANSKEEFEKILSKWYNTWLKDGSLEYHGVESEIIKYTRKNQASKLYSKVESTLFA